MIINTIWAAKKAHRSNYLCIAASNFNFARLLGGFTLYFRDLAELEWFFTRPSGYARQTKPPLKWYKLFTILELCGKRRGCVWI